MLVSTPFFSFCQYNLEFGIGAGGANYLGEIGGREKNARPFVTDMHLEQTRLAGSFFVRYRFAPEFHVKLALSVLQIAGNDKLSINPGRAGRNLEFQNNIHELALTGQFNFYNAYDIFRAIRKKRRIDYSIYAFGGGAGFYHNPKARYADRLLELRPLMTEGQSKPYNRYEFAIPMGIGMHYTIRKQHRIGFEFGWRLTFTDYLDDISTNYASPEQLKDPLAIKMANRRNELSGDPGIPSHIYYEPGQKRGDPTNNDSYFVALVTYSILFRDRNIYYRSNYYNVGRRKMRF